MLTKTKLLQAAVALLLLLNVAIVVHFRLHRPPHHKRDALKNQVTNVLRLDESQVKAYEQLIDQHRQNIRQKEADMLAQKRQLYTLLTGDNLAQKDTLLQRIGQIQQEIERVHFDHFEAVKKLCRPDQMAYFQSIPAEIVRHLGPPPMPENQQQ